MSKKSASSDTSNSGKNYKRTNNNFKSTSNIKSKEDSKDDWVKLIFESLFGKEIFRCSVNGKRTKIRKLKETLMSQVLKGHKDLNDLLLLYGEEILENDRTVHSYGITDRSRLLVTPRIKGGTSKREVTGGKRIRDISRQIQTGVDDILAEMKVKGQTMRDDDVILFDVDDDDHVHLRRVSAKRMQNMPAKSKIGPKIAGQISSASKFEQDQSLKRSKKSLESPKEKQYKVLKVEKICDVTSMENDNRRIKRIEDATGNIRFLKIIPKDKSASPTPMNSWQDSFEIQKETDSLAGTTRPEHRGIYSDQNEQLLSKLRKVEKRETSQHIDFSKRQMTTGQMVTSKNGSGGSGGQQRKLTHGKLTSLPKLPEDPHRAESESDQSSMASECEPPPPPPPPPTKTTGTNQQDWSREPTVKDDSNEVWSRLLAYNPAETNTNEKKRMELMWPVKEEHSESSETKKKKKKKQQQQQKFKPKPKTDDDTSHDESSSAEDATEKPAAKLKATSVKYAKTEYDKFTSTEPDGRAKTSLISAIESVSAGADRDKRQKTSFGPGSSKMTHKLPRDSSTDENQPPKSPPLFHLLKSWCRDKYGNGKKSSSWDDHGKSSLSKEKNSTSKQQEPTLPPPNKQQQQSKKDGTNKG